jgi:hypothetical protein
MNPHFAAAAMLLWDGPQRPPLTSILILAFSAVALLYAVYWFGHLKLLAADLREVDSLRQEGLLSPAGNPIEDYRTLTVLLDSLAPAASIRLELWVSLYFQMLRVARLTSWSRARVEEECSRLVAYQGALYRQACATLAEIRS